jgi:hypothetical protein
MILKVLIDEMRPTALVECGRIALHPPKDAGMVDSDPAFP